MDKKLGLFDTNKYSKKCGFRKGLDHEQIEELLELNHLLYELTFKEMDRIWLKLVKYPDAEEIINGEVVIIKNKYKPYLPNNNEYWEQIKRIEKYLSREYDNLKYGGSHKKEQNSDFCIECRNYKKVEGVQRREWLNDIQCETDVKNHLCPYIEKIRKEF